ncbi:terminase large subunit [Listeria booriae]|uniref:terminase TerL endonuclease subunit n=1 Tax=Listeria booriae TaxID=1552123 RepID=UPI001626E772|nr:terminase TerL endonuclease subunit [Listeria booriae]MBC1230543.1 terminase large subunit [Listeria booriae]
MIKQKYVDAYIKDFETGKVLFNEERKQLIRYLKEDILTRDDLFFDDKMIEDCINFGEKWYFPLQPFQKFLIAFIFLFHKKNKKAFYRKFLWMLGRGGGKNGLISVVTHFLISELHGINEYSISIVANSEDQAKTSFDEVFNAIEFNPDVLKKAFINQKAKIEGRKTKAILKFRTSNGNTKDGLRDGAVVFDEIHQYLTNQDVKVHISGLGKRKNPREFYIGTDGYIREGFLDKLKDKAQKVLTGEARPNSIFPFICKLDNEDEVFDPKNWEMSNPMLSEPRSEYAEVLYDAILEEFEDLEEDPSNREEFMTKRMNLPVEDLERSVATWEEILATNRPFPDISKSSCIGSLDYASIRDFAACGLLFRHDEDYVFKTHSFARKRFVDIYYGYSKTDDVIKKEKFAPIKEWEQEGLLTVVDEPSINPMHIVNWFVEMRKQYGVNKIIADNYKMDILRPLFEAEGFEIEIIRNPRAIHGLLAPRIESAFANHQIIFDNNPLMRWYTNNVLVRIKKDGNKEYLKKDEVRRKTDGFQSFVHAMYRADEIINVDYSEALDFLNAIDF